MNGREEVHRGVVCWRDEQHPLPAVHLDEEVVGEVVVPVGSDVAMGEPDSAVWLWGNLAQPACSINGATQSHSATARGCGGAYLY